MKIEKQKAFYYLRVFFINIVLFALIFFILEFLCHLFFVFKQLPPEEQKQAICSFFESYKPETVKDQVEFPDTFRPVVYGNKHKKPIVLLGCTFAHGEFLKDNETLGYQLSKYTGRTVYNYGMASTSPRETLWLLRHSNIVKSDINPEYVIMPYVIDLKKRIYMIGWPNSSLIMPIFTKTKAGELQYQPIESPLLNSKILRFLNYYGVAKKMEYREEADDLINVYFLAIKKELEKKYPSAKFVILIYCADGGEKWDVLKENGIIVTDVKSLTNKDLITREYQISDDNIYPNAKAWGVIVPPFSKFLKL